MQKREGESKERTAEQIAEALAHCLVMQNPGWVEKASEAEKDFVARVLGKVARKQANDK